MFAVNGPSGPTNRNERRMRDNEKPTKEQIEAQREKRESFFCPQTVKPSRRVQKPKPHTADNAQSDKENGVSQIFKGCRIYFNGRTGNISSYYLTKLIQQHGGNMAREFKVTKVTHIVACNLNGSKADKLIKSCGKIKCIHPEWILQSVRQGKKLPVHEFLVYKDSSARILTTALTSNKTEVTSDGSTSAK